MGPRLFSRGNAKGVGLMVAGDSGLQWGRGFSAAESSTGLSGTDCIYLLQWGRGFSAAESCGTATLPGESGGRFNGAAAFQPRKWPSHTPSGKSWGLRAAAFQPRKLQVGAK